MPRSLHAHAQAHVRLTTLHIYRHLLRQSSYLPPVCQTYTRDQIRTRFRHHHHDDPVSPSTKLRLRRAQHDLRYLCAANNGLHANMLRILLLTYGRLGKRRRLLIHHFVAKPPPADQQELADHIRNEQARHPKRLKRDWLDGWNLSKLHALAESQARRSFWSPKPELKGRKLAPEEEIPKENTWGRPMPAKLARSKLRRLYIAMINRIMPPVGKSEWDTLALLATGKADPSLGQMPPRRPQARSLYGEDVDGGKEGRKAWDWRAYATTPVRSIERGSSRSQKARTGEQGEAPYGLGSAIGTRNYDRSRMWKRLYNRIWEMTPTMTEVDGQRGKWEIRWGQTLREVPFAAPGQTAFFEGAVAAKGKKSRKKQRPAPE